jgi:hypothetical protein
LLKVYNALQHCEKVFYFAIQSTFMEKEKYLQDLKEIRNIMDRSSRFISLSGMSGVSAGIIAFAGALYAHTYLFAEGRYLEFQAFPVGREVVYQVIGLALGMFILAIGGAVLLAGGKARKKQTKLWDKSSKRLLINLLIPLGTGGILCLIFLLRGYIGLVVPLSLISYGLALVNDSKYSLDELRSLGMLEIGLGLAGMVFISYGLLFWAIGFGGLHIVYGLMMHYKYDA